MKKSIEKIVVLGAGTMGARIAAHVANAGIWCALLDMVPPDLTPEESKRPEARNRIVRAGLAATEGVLRTLVCEPGGGVEIADSTAASMVRRDRHCLDPSGHHRQLHSPLDERILSGRLILGSLGL